VKIKQESHNYLKFSSKHWNEEIKL